MHISVNYDNKKLKNHTLHFKISNSTFVNLKYLHKWTTQEPKYLPDEVVDVDEDEESSGGPNNGSNENKSLLTLLALYNLNQNRSFNARHLPINHK